MSATKIRKKLTEALPIPRSVWTTPTGQLFVVMATFCTVLFMFWLLLTLPVLLHLKRSLDKGDALLELYERRCQSIQP